MDWDLLPLIAELHSGDSALSVKQACETALALSEDPRHACIALSTLRRHAKRYLNGERKMHRNMLLTAEDGADLRAVCSAFYFIGKPLTQAALIAVVKARWPELAETT